MKVVVLSDTHAPRRWRSCPSPVAGHLRGADLILHAGVAIVHDSGRLLAARIVPVT